MTAVEFDVAVVGGGIVGASCAYWAADAGLRVYACDRISPGAGTTGAGMGHIVALEEPPAMLPLTRYSQRLWRELAPRLPPSVGFRAVGTLWVAGSEQELAELGRKQLTLRAGDTPSEVLERDALHALEPALSPDLSGALLVEEDCLVDPVPATRYLWKSSAARGARVEPHRAVSRILEGAVEFLDGSQIRAENVVNATGVDAPTLTPECPILARKGHLIRWGPARNLLRHAVVEVGYSTAVRDVDRSTVAFNAQPQTDGSVLLGASREWAGTDLTVDPTIVERLCAHARKFLPSLLELPRLEVRTGLRPGTPDRLPWIGRLPESDGLWIAAGHEGLGVTTSLGTGKLLADLLLGRPTAIPASRFAPTPDRLSGAGSLPS
ncbi:MAG: FAD-dependent oxidoreductase [Thermoplasmata archaeon]